MNESAYTRSINKMLPKHVYRVKLNAPYTAGLPDTWYSSDKGDIWIEWKLVKTTPSRRLTIGLSELQKLWLNGRYDEGRSVAVLVGTPSGVLIVREKQWNEPLTEFTFHTKRETAEWITNQVSTLAPSAITPPVSH